MRYSLSILSLLEKPLTYDEWVSILGLSTKYDIPTARREAIVALTYSRISSARLLALARSSHVPQWVDRSLKCIINTKFSSFSSLELDWMGSEVLHEVIQYHTRVTDHRAYTAFKVCPVKHTESCSDNAVCSSRWAPFFQAATRSVLWLPHSDMPGPVYCPGSTGYDWLESQAIQYLRPDCRLATLAVLKEKRVFTMEDHLREETLARLRDICRDAGSRGSVIKAQAPKSAAGSPEPEEWQGTPDVLSATIA